MPKTKQRIQIFYIGFIILLMIVALFYHNSAKKIELRNHSTNSICIESLTRDYIMVPAMGQVIANRMNLLGIERRYFKIASLFCWMTIFFKSKFSFWYHCIFIQKFCWNFNNQVILWYIKQSDGKKRLQCSNFVLIKRRA